MICKNCQHEFEKGKFCPECGFPIDEKKDKDKGEEALEMIRNIDNRTKALEERFTKVDQRKKEKEKEKENNDKTKTKADADAASKRKRGILDIF